MERLPFQFALRERGINRVTPIVPEPVGDEANEQCGLPSLSRISFTTSRFTISLLPPKL